MKQSRREWFGAAAWVLGMVGVAKAAPVAARTLGVDLAAPGGDKTVAGVWRIERQPFEVYDIDEFGLLHITRAGRAVATGGPMIESLPLAEDLLGDIPPGMMRNWTRWKWNVPATVLEWQTQLVEVFQPKKGDWVQWFTPESEIKIANAQPDLSPKELAWIVDMWHAGEVGTVYDVSADGKWAAVSDPILKFVHPDGAYPYPERPEFEHVYDKFGWFRVIETAKLRPYRGRLP